MATIATRPATAADWTAIARLLRDHGLPLEGAREHVPDFIVAERSGRLVGCAAVEVYGDAGLLRSVAVKPNDRGHGIGAALVESCFVTARGRDLASLTLLTTTAEPYFRRFGFERIDRERVPRALHASEEFRGACPATATAMFVSLRESQGAAASASPSVRTATRQDAATIAEIYNAGIRARTATFETRERTAGEIESWFDSRYPILVAELEGRVVGWIAASSYRGRDCYAGIAEFSVYVHPAMQRRRVADSLMGEFLATLERSGFWKVLSRIFPENAASLALCRRHGFRVVGTYERHGKLEGGWRDCVIVERLLGDAGPTRWSPGP
jgi:L-amino acid N-acyltransferase YncA